MSNKKSNYISLQIKGLGPLKNSGLNNEKIGALQPIIFARNGSGKSFISRAFRLIELFQQNKLPILANNMISFGENKMNFYFKVHKQDDHGHEFEKQEFSVTCERGNAPTVSNKSDWKVHVFNQDFIRDAVTQQTFTLDSPVAGEIIVGEDNNETQGLVTANAKLKEECVTLENEINREIQVSREQLNSDKKFSNLNEFKDLKYDKIYEQRVQNHHYEETLKRWEDIKSAPENWPTISTVSCELNWDLLIKIKRDLKKTVPISAVCNELKQQIQKHVEFFRKGLSLFDEQQTSCPFCHQSITSEVFTNTIEQYRRYFADEEAKFVEDLSQDKAVLLAVQNKLKETVEKLDSNTLLYDDQKKYFADLVLSNLGTVDCFERMQSNIEKLLKLLEIKINNKEKDDFKTDAVFDELADDVHSLDKQIQNINFSIQNIEHKKENKGKYNLQTRKDLCRELAAKIHIDNADKIKKIEENKLLISSNEARIQEIKGRMSASKKDRVTQCFKKLLREFFNDKYSFDAETGILKHLNKNPIQAANDVLSDGEKGIIAFAHYVALIHSVVEKKEDYNKLLLIIDDPISSMDFTFIYQVSYIIRNLKDFIEDIEGNIRYILLTHNYEFANIAICNNIVCSQFYIENGAFKKYQKENLLPYEAHLTHIEKIVNENAKIEYYTPNALRHVLETINSFLYPKRDLKSGLLQEEYFQKDKLGEGYTLMQDLSHGRVRGAKCHTDEDIKKIATLVIGYIKDNFNGQLAKE